jgi:hypothetical protein
MSIYQAETFALDYESFRYINDTENQQYQYWNEVEDKFQSISISQLYRSNYTNTEYPQPPSITKYTLITMQTAFIIFWLMYLIYALILAIIKCQLSKDFRSANLGDKLQHLVEAINLPEVYGDWDNEFDLDVADHQRKWRQVLIEMVIMAFMQLITNLCLLVPFWITGMYPKLNKQYKEHTIFSYKETRPIT